MKLEYIFSLAIFCIIKVCVVADGKSLVPALFIFGDSLIDVGNNNKLLLTLAKANLPPNGVDYPGKKPTGRFSNGFNSADFMARRLGLGEVSPPPNLSLGKINMTTFKGVNFASGGAGILSTTGSSVLQRITLSNQVSDFMNVRNNLVSLVGETSTQALLNNSLFMFVIGSNDLFSFSNTQGQTPEEFISKLSSSLSNELLKLYQAGLRKVAFVGTGPIGCCPSQRLKIPQNGCAQSENDLSSKFYMAVGAVLANMSSSLQGFSYSLCNTNMLVTEYIQNGKTYGFTDTSSACCGQGNLNAEFPCILVANVCQNRDAYLFWDLFHPTQRLSQLITDVLFDGPSKFVIPLNVGQLVAAI